nr:retrotransposon-related protein [Tanacetum cinerariifolium]
MLPIELTNKEIKNTKAYKEYYAFTTGEAAPKPKASARRTMSVSTTSITPPTAAATPRPTVAATSRLTAAAKGKQPAKAPKAKSTDEGTGSKPGVLDVPTDESEEELSWNSFDDEGVDDQGKDGDDDEKDEGDDHEEEEEDDDKDKDGDERDYNDEDQMIAKDDEQDDTEGSGDDDEEVRRFMLDLKQHFWWSGTKRDVATFVSRCLICQQVKIEHQRASGLLQPLDILVWKWDEISMDFVTGLPRTQRRHDAIWVVVDRLTKSAHFLPIRKDYSVSKLAETFQQEIVRLHGTPSAITDGQTERTIQTLEDMLRSCALEWSGNWDDYICLVEFAYNNSWHASIKCAPFEMLYGRKCRAPICWGQVGERVIEGPEMIEVTNEKVAVAKEKLKEARTRQKSYADKHRKSLEFQPEGTSIILFMSFHIHSIRSVRIYLKSLSHVHNVFHVSLLRGYKYHPLHVISYPLNQIRADLSYVEEPEAILDRQDRVMRNKTIPFVKILWRNHPEREATWETEESIQTSYPHFLP